MRKNILYIVIVFLIIICLFATSALCSWCGNQTVEDEKKVDVETSDKTSEEVKKESTETEEEITEEEVEEGIEEEITPTIELEIYEGPLYSPSDNVCYYRIKANVTGTPTPDVEFSKDDSYGYWGEYKAQVNLNSPSATYTLIATATNSEGTATDSIELSWGCSTNNPPKITDLFISPGTKFTGSKCDVIVTATDLDGDNLNYKWSTGGGYFDSITVADTEWTAPDTAGTYNITITVSDGNGGVDTETITVEVESSQTQPTINKYIPVVLGEGGRSNENGGYYGLNYFTAGDDGLFNDMYKGFISFDITGLTGTTITEAELSFSVYGTQGDVSNFLPLGLFSVYWGDRKIEVTDFYITGDSIESFTAPNFTCSHSNLRQYIQNAIDSGKPRFQVMIHFTGLETDNDSVKDTWSYKPNGINLNVTYTQ